MKSISHLTFLAALLLITVDAHAGVIFTNVGNTMVRASNGAGNTPPNNNQVISNDLTPFDSTVSATRDGFPGSSSAHLTLTVVPDSTGGRIFGSSGAVTTFTDGASVLYYTGWDIRIQVDTLSSFSLAADILSSGSGNSFVEFFQLNNQGQTFPGSLDVLYGSGTPPYGATANAVGTGSYSALSAGTTSGVLLPGLYEFVGSSINGLGGVGGFASTFDLQISAVPEPSAAIFGGFALIVGICRRKRLK